jgi:hypothetical protein
MEYHCDPVELVYAVSNPHSWRLIAAMIGQMVGKRLVDITDSYQFEDFRNDLLTHGAVIVFRSSTFIHRPDSCEGGHPRGAEKLDWYSREAVDPERFESVMTGRDMLRCLKLGKEDFTARRDELLRRYRKKHS